VGASCLLTLLLVRAAIAARPGRRFRRSPHARSQPLAASLGSRLARQHRAIACIRMYRDSQGISTTPSSSGRDPTAGLASSSADTKASSRWTIESSGGGRERTASARRRGSELRVVVRTTRHRWRLDRDDLDREGLLGPVLLCGVFRRRANSTVKLLNDSMQSDRSCSNATRLAG
jgi:hypothetical protein